MKSLRLLCLGFICILTLAGCGKRGPLVAPETLRYPVVADLAARQRGSEVQLTWTTPYGPGSGVASFRLYRREVLPPAQDCEECTNAYQLVRSVDLEMLNGVTRDGDRFTASDGGQQREKTYQYRLHALLKDGTSVAVSNPARVAMRTLPAPPRLAAEATPVSVLLSWEPIPQPVGATSVRYQVYRRQGDAPWGAAPVTPRPQLATRYEDFPPQTGATWHYTVRALVGYDGVLAETDPAEEATVTLPPPEK
jgi:predicted small lipoprotein YifL